MRHAVGLLVLLLGLGLPAEAQYFSEGGNNDAWGDLSRSQFEPQANPQELSRIVDELKALQNAEQYDADTQLPYGRYEAGDWEATANEEPNPEELAKIGRDLQQLLWDQQQQEQPAEEPVKADSQPEQAEEPKQEAKQPLTAQKKGQYEFVEFVEPQAAKALKNVEYLDKRAPVADFEGVSSSKFIYGSNNVFFIVAVTVCSVASVVGIAGGAYYFNTVRKQRAEAFDDFTRYSPAGPGRDMLRKGRGMAGSPITDSGDHDLAKAAHLHHYEQTKQKIIGDDNGINNDDQSDDEANDLEEHNFSIYECPGLAPTTGDLEVNNPSFAKQNP
ncbi:hypothetical protein M3Y99_00078400 [Aphelenchoides fujianensis]|nr:hypothetical protein M3Y99_00078400 [Aphelenchoides fujianensis]